MRPDIYLAPVRLLKDTGAAKAGDIGTVVEVYAIIEFCGDDGRTTAMLMAHPDSFERVNDEAQLRPPPGQFESTEADGASAVLRAEVQRLQGQNEELKARLANLRAGYVPPRSAPRPWRSDCGHVLDEPCKWCAIEKEGKT